MYLLLLTVLHEVKALERKLDLAMMDGGWLMICTVEGMGECGVLKSANEPS